MKTREMEIRDARLVAKSFLGDYPQSFRLLGADVVSLMVGGYVLRRVIAALEDPAHRPHPHVLSRFKADVFNIANHLSAVGDGCSCAYCRDPEQP